MKIPVAIISSLLSVFTSKVGHSVDIATKMQCADRANAFLKTQRETYSSSNGYNALIKNEEFTYSKRMETCLVYFEILEIDAGVSYNIVDILTNKRLFYHATFFRDKETQRLWEKSCGDDQGCLSMDDFKKKRSELFDEKD